MDVGDLERDELALLRSNCHHLASSLAQVLDVGAVGHFILGTCSGKRVLQDADALTPKSWHHSDASPGVDRNLYLNPFVRLLDNADSFNFHG